MKKQCLDLVVKWQLSTSWLEKYFFRDHSITSIKYLIAFSGKVGLSRREFSNPDGSV